MDDLILTKLIGMSDATRQKLIRHYARMPELLRLHVHQLQTEHMRRLRQHWQHGQPALAYYSLLCALQELVELEHVDKARRPDTEKLQMAERLRVEKIKATTKVGRKSESRDRLLHQRPLIKRLRDEDQLSWRQIARYLAEYQQITVSHTYIREVYEEYGNHRDVVRLPALPEPGGETPLK